MWAFDDNGDDYDDLMVSAPGEVCDPIMSDGYHQFRGHPNRIVSNKLLNNPTDVLECVGWDTSEPSIAGQEYAQCMNFGDPGCGQALTDAFGAMNLSTEAGHIAACEVALDFALDACEHWVTDPICDVDLCIAASLELSEVAGGCNNEGDVLTHGY